MSTYDSPRRSGYENQDETQADMNVSGKFTTVAEGRFSFRSVKPSPYPVPTDGPVGELLRMAKGINAAGVKPESNSLRAAISR
jgi:protocatechuate 3,4-dioxygenase beta subunit